MAWPLEWNLPLAAAALLLSLAGLALALGRGLANGRQLGWALGGVLVGLALGCGAADGLLRALQSLKGDPRPWTGHPDWATLAAVAVTVFAVLAVAALLARRTSAWAWWSATALLLSVAGGVLAWRLPGASPHGLVPALGVSAALVLGTLLPRALGTSFLLIGLAVAAWPWLSIGYALHVMTGPDLSLGLSVPAGVLATILAASAPAERGRWRPALAALAIAAVAWTTASVLPRYSRDLPRHANLLHVENAGLGRAWWFATAHPPDELLAALAPVEVEIPDFPTPGSVNSRKATPAEPTGSPAPVLEIVERVETDFGRTLRATFASRRGADVVEIRVPMEARLRAARFQGRDASVRPGAAQRLVVRGLPPGGLNVELDLEGDEPATIVVADRVRALPPTAERYLQARPPNAVPVQEGDVSIVYAALELP